MIQLIIVHTAKIHSIGSNQNLRLTSNKKKNPSHKMIFVTKLVKDSTNHEPTKSISSLE